MSAVTQRAAQGRGDARRLVARMSKPLVASMMVLALLGSVFPAAPAYATQVPVGYHPQEHRDVEGAARYLYTDVAYLQRFGVAAIHFVLGLNGQVGRRGVSYRDAVDASGPVTVVSEFSTPADAEALASVMSFHDVSAVQAAKIGAAFVTFLSGVDAHRRGVDVEAFKTNPPLPLSATPPARGPHRVWFYDFQNNPVRWDPCTPVTWTMGPSGAPPTAALDTAEAMRRLSWRTGLTFTAVPYGTPAQLTVRWGPESVFPQLSGSTLGYAEVEWRSRLGRTTFTSAEVLIDTGEGLVGGFGPRSIGVILLHELGHAVGLAHPNDFDHSPAAQLQVMSSNVFPAVSDFRDGDAEGLWMVGASQGCLLSAAAAFAERDAPGTVGIISIAD
jgi:hypothetical protein